MPRPLNVMFDHQIVVNQVFGGISRYFASMVPELDAYDVRGRFVAPLYHNQYLAELPRRYVLGRHIPASPIARRLANVAAAVAIPAVARLRRPDVVHETYYASRRLAPRGIPMVLTVYDMIHELYPQHFTNDPTAHHKKNAIDRADRILCISENTRRDLIRLYPDAESRCVVTYLGFSPEFIGNPRRDVARPYLLYVGPRGGYKNFAGLLSAFATSRQLTKAFDILCVGGGRFDEEETRAIRAAGCDGQVRQVVAHDAELQHLYAGAAAFVYPSLYEGFGIPPLEAMAADCPVVTLNSSSIPEVCGDAAQYAASEDPQDLRIAIEAVVMSPDRTAELVRRGRAQLHRFSWAKCAAQTAAIYRAIV